MLSGFGLYVCQWQCGYAGIRVGEASHPGPYSDEHNLSGADMDDTSPPGEDSLPFARTQADALVDHIAIDSLDEIRMEVLSDDAYRNLERECFGDEIIADANTPETWRDESMQVTFDQTSAPPTPSEVPAPFPLVGHCVPGVRVLPNAWSSLNFIDLKAELIKPARTLKAIPHCIRDSYLRILTQVLARMQQAHRCLSSISATDERYLSFFDAHVGAWKLFILLPRMLLYSTRRGGLAGARDLRKRINLFDEEK